MNNEFVNFIVIFIEKYRRRGRNFCTGKEKKVDQVKGQVRILLIESLSLRAINKQTKRLN